jgi:hypothetical protein
VLPSLAGVEAAIAAASFDKVDPAAARIFEAGLLVRLRRNAAALDALSRLRGPVDAEASLLRIRAFLGLGSSAAAEKALAEAARAFPDNAAVARLFFTTAKPALSQSSRELADFFIRRLASYATQDAEIALAALPYVPSVEDRKRLVAAYRATGGAKGSLEALEYGLIDADAVVAEFFGGTAKVDRAALERLDRLVGEGPARATLAKALAAYTGSVTEDRDGDGVPETVTDYEKGRPVRWTSDANQDGEHELVVEFRYGEAARATLAVDGLDLALEWQGFPHVLTLVYSDKTVVGGPIEIGTPPEAPGRIARYSLLPEGLAYAPFSAAPFPSSDSGFVLFAPTGNAPPSETAAAAAAWNLESEEAGRTLLIRLVDGIAQDGSVEMAGTVRGKIEFKNGRPTREILDQDGDGRFESILHLDPGSPPSKPLALSLDADLDGDGVYEYHEDYFPPYRRTWDFNADGRIDAVEKKASDGSVTREFSTRLDGVMDEGLTLSKDGILLSIVRRGAIPALLPDRNPRLRWIALKPFDLGDAMPTTEGVYLREGKRYRLIAAGGVFLAEVLP